MNQSDIAVYGGPHTSRRTIRVGCGEWGFRELPLERHFEIACEFQFRCLEFGIGGNRTGRLSEEPLHDVEDGIRRSLQALREYSLGVEFA